MAGGAQRNPTRARVRGDSSRRGGGDWTLRLKEALGKHANERGQVAITFTNSGYMHYAMNWLWHVQEVEVSNYLVLALDEPAFDSLTAHGANVFYEASLDQGRIERGATDFGSAGFKKIVHLKPLLTSAVLELGFELLLSDADVVWLCNPFEREEVTDSPLAIMSDAHHGYGMGPTPYFVNSGFAYMKPTEETRLLMREVVRLLESRPDKMDQDAYNTAISNWDRRFPSEALVLTIMDPAKVANGWVYFVRQLSQRSGMEPIAVHNNWADGEAGSTNIQKVFRFREHLLWQVPDQEHDGIEEVKGLLMYELPMLPDGKRYSVWEQVEALEGALAVAQILDRALILPDVKCSEDEGGDEMRCTFDAFVDIKALLGEFAHVRESTFLSNPFRKQRDVGVKEEISGVRLKASMGESEVRTSLSQTNALPVLLLQDFSPSSFSGFDHPVHQLYFDKAKRRGVREPFYAREAANRIRLTYLDPYCIALLLPKECTQVQASSPSPSSSSCVHEVADALISQSWLRRDCVFVAGEGVIDRSQAVLGEMLKPLDSVFEHVIFIGEGKLDFPLCDAWQLRDHYLVTSIELAVVGQQELCLVVTPQDSTSAFHIADRAVIRRDGEHSPAVHDLDRHSKTVKARERKAKCPAPAYDDNRMLKESITVCLAKGSHYESVLTLNRVWVQDVGLEMQHTHRRLGMASVCFEEAAQKDPRDLQAYQLLANSHLARNQHDQAAAAYERANLLAPDSAAMINMGVAMQRNGKTKEASEAYETALRIDPTRHEAHHNLAGCLQDLGRYEESEGHYREALQLNPTFAQSYGALGNILYSQGRMQEAAAVYRHSVELDPLDQQHHLGTSPYPSAICLTLIERVLHASGKYQEEQAVYTSAVALHPKLALAYSYLATSILSEYQRAIGYRSYGKVPEDQDYLDRAYALYNTSLEIDSNCGMCHGQLGDMMKDSHRINLAVHHYTSSSSLLPHVPTIFCNLVYTKMFACDWSDYDKNFQRILDMVAGEVASTPPPQYHCVQPLQGNLYRPLEAPLMRKLTETYVKRLLLSHLGTENPAPLPLPAHLSLPAQDKRLRLGYLSADFKDHPVAKRIQDVFALHDKAKVRVTCYSLNVDDGSHYRAKIARDSEVFHDLAPRLQSEGFRAVASFISADAADVLINLAGHTRGNDHVTLIMALGPSPVQLMHEGYAGTMGGARHSAHLTDRVSSPPEFAEHYVEGLFYMPECFFVNDHKQTYSELLHDHVTPQEKSNRLSYGSLSPDMSTGFVMGAFNQVHKIDPGIWNTWMDAIMRVKDGHIWMIKIHSTDPEMNLRREAEALGVPGSRIHVTQGYNEKEHLFVKAAADIFLDTPSYNAHSSGCDVLWAGLPIVTLAGDKMASRVAASLVASMGCEETIVRTEGEYADLLVALGTSSQGLRETRECVRKGKISSGLFDTKDWVNHQEAGIRMASDVAFSRGGGEAFRTINVVVAKNRPQVG